MKVELLLTYSLMGTNHHHRVLKPQRLSAVLARSAEGRVLRGQSGVSGPGLLSAGGIRATDGVSNGKKGNANVKGS